MANERSSRLADVLETICILNAVETDWPRGAKNLLIKEALDRKKQELHEASQKLMERAGHTRVTIGASYYGSRRVKTANPEQSGNQVIPEGDE